MLKFTGASLFSICFQLIMGAKLLLVCFVIFLFWGKALYLLDCYLMKCYIFYIKKMSYKLDKMNENE